MSDDRAEMLRFVWKQVDETIKDLYEKVFAAQNCLEDALASAYRRGAEVMRERTAQTAAAYGAVVIAETIRALPIEVGGAGTPIEDRPCPSCGSLAHDDSQCTDPAPI